jgi:RHS repeat-associated protein
VALQYSGAGNLVASDGGFVYSRDAGDGLLGVNTVGGSTSTGRLALTDLHTDVVGTVTATGAALSGSATYDPLGNPVGALTRLGNLGYQSEYTDPGSGQVNMAARCYNPATGQFISKDSVAVNPVGNSAAANPFAYVADDPMIGTDPSGHCSWWNPVCDAKAVVHAAVQVVTPVVHAVSDFVEDDIIRPAEHFYQAYVAPVVHAVVHVATTVVHRVRDAYHRTVQRVRSYVHRQVARVTTVVRRVTKAATHVVKTAYHAAAKATKTAATFVKNHAATIISFAVSTVAFMGCEAALGALTAGVGAVAGAVVCGAFAGMVGGLVDQGAKCLGGQKGACSAGSFVKAGIIGGVVGAAGGALGGVGGKLLGKLAPKALDVLGGLFGRGASEAADAAATDGAEAAAGAETRAATESAQSSVDNAGQAAKTAERPGALKPSESGSPYKHLPGRPNPKDLRAGTGTPREMPDVPEDGDPNEAQDAADWVKETGETGFKALPPRPGAINAEVPMPAGPGPVITKMDHEAPVGSEILGLVLGAAALKRAIGIVVKRVLGRIASRG